MADQDQRNTQHSKALWEKQREAKPAPRLEMPEMRAVIQHQDGHDLAVSQPRLWSALLGRLRALPQQQCLPVRAKGLAKIIELTEILHEPVEHGRLPTSDGANSKRGTRSLQGLGLIP